MTQDQQLSNPVLADDPLHPIPFVNALDVQAVWKEGGSDLGIIVASPLAADEHSLERLLSKIEAYLRFIGRTDFKEQCGMPNPQNTRIVAYLHPDSDPRVEQVLSRCKPWVESHFANLLVQYLGPDLTPYAVPRN
jgi:hypothetical protein